MKRILIFIAIFFITFIFIMAAFFLYNTRDRHKGYFVDLDIKASNDGIVHAGFAAMKITPDITDTWTDVKGNSRFIPEEGDSFMDVTGSGGFDAV